LRSALNPAPEKEFEQAQLLCKSFIEAVIVQHGENPCH